MKTLSSSTEDRLLVCCADMRDGEQTYARAEEMLSGDIDWNRVIRKAVRHGVASLLYSLINRTECRGRVPDAVVERLRKIYCANALRNIKMEDQLLSILRRLRRQGIDCIVLKGLFVAKSVYKDIALRPIGDIDLLIHPGDLPEVDRVLRALGYSPGNEDVLQGFYRSVHFHTLYSNDRTDPRVPLEVHWHLQDRFHVLRIDIDRIWDRALPWDIGDTQTGAMWLGDLLAYLCYHADKHACYSRYIRDYSSIDPDIVLCNDSSTQLIWYAEILRLIRLKESDLSWPSFTQNCRNWGIEGEVYSTLALVNRVFGVSVAKEALLQLNPPEVTGFQSRLYSAVFAGVRAENGLPHSLPDRLRARLLRPDSTLRFRPFRLLEVFAYVLPDISLISKRYSASAPASYLYYSAHVVSASSRCMIYLALLLYCTLRKHSCRLLKRLRHLGFRWLFIT
jgi:hypothetical protein